jgi:SAM-dependent methyltransferase
VIGSLRHYVHHRQFRPGLAGLFLTPFFLARRALWREIASLAPRASGRVLDVGCGTKPYRSLFQVGEYIGLEYDTPLARARGIADQFYDGGRFPFEDASFDVLLCNQVLEHVFNPGEFAAELRRVLRPGGALILTVPFVWDEHEQPYDYARYSSFGLKALLVQAGFDLQVQRSTLADASILFQLTNAYLFKVFSPRRPITHLALSALLCAPVSALGWLAGKILPGNADLFLDQVVLATAREH